MRRARTTRLNCYPTPVRPTAPRARSTRTSLGLRLASTQPARLKASDIAKAFVKTLKRNSDHPGARLCLDRGLAHGRFVKRGSGHCAGLRHHMSGHRADQRLTLDPGGLCSELREPEYLFTHQINKPRAGIPAFRQEKCNAKI
jgi:hypothetical protein